MGRPVLPALARMRRSSEFTATVRGGRRGSTRAVTVHIALPAVTGPHLTEAGPARVGFVVSRAVGSAVVRNQVRRRLRHLVRARLESFPAGSTVVVRAQPSAAGLPSSMLARELDRALARAGEGVRT